MQQGVAWRINFVENDFVGVENLLLNDDLPTTGVLSTQISRAALAARRLYRRRRSSDALGVDWQ
jgi:hypothetical protein